MSKVILALVYSVSVATRTLSAIRTTGRTQGRNTEGTPGRTPWALWDAQREALQDAQRETLLDVLRRHSGTHHVRHS